MKTEYIEYQEGDTALEGYLAYDERREQPRPGVLVGHDWTGRREFACDRAEWLAELGYVGFAADIFGKGVFGKPGDFDGNSALIAPFVEDRGLLRRRMQVALATLREDPRVDGANIGAVGYCFGGMAVLELARSGADIKGVASMHGLLRQGDVPNADINAKVLALHGYDDPMVPPEQVQHFATEMTDAGVDWQIHIYGDTMHAFTNPAADNPDAGTVYSERANRRAEATLTDFFAELFA